MIFNIKDVKSWATRHDVEVAVIDGCPLTIINGRALKYWFDNYEIMNHEGKWQPFGAVENTGE